MIYILSRFVWLFVLYLHLGVYSGDYRVTVLFTFCRDLYFAHISGFIQDIHLILGKSIDTIVVDTSSEFHPVPVYTFQITQDFNNPNGHIPVIIPVN